MTENKCPKFLGIFIRHKWGKEKWWLPPMRSIYTIDKYIAERKCLVCGEVQQYYQSGISAGWEKIGKTTK